jgi:hypothetical protein
MLNKHESHARVSRQIFQEICECFQPTCGSADANYGKKLISRGLWKFSISFLWRPVFSSEPSQACFSLPFFSASNNPQEHAYLHFQI